MEKELHRVYHHKRVRGEWFALTEEDIDSVKKQYSQAIVKSKAA